jgi:hypothetical protein
MHLEIAADLSYLAVMANSCSAPLRQLPVTVRSSLVTDVISAAVRRVPFTAPISG